MESSSPMVEHDRGELSDGVPLPPPRSRDRDGLSALERKALYRLNIPVVAEDVGGEYGRSVRFVAATGALTVRSLVGGDREL